MAVLVALQFTSPKEHIVNAGAGGSVGGQIQAGLGKIRPPGTFAYNNGVTGFTAMVLSMLLHRLAHSAVFPRQLVLAAAPCVLVLVGMSGSRTNVGNSALVVACFLAICLGQRELSKSARAFVTWGMIGIGAFFFLDTFDDAIGIFQERFKSIEDVKTGFFGRFFEQFLSPFMVLPEARLLGMGVGTGTNAAAGLLYGQRTFMLSEGEWQRIILEIGPILGFSYIGLRIAIVIHLFKVGLRSLKRDKNTLPLLLLAGGFSDIMQGQFGQPTTLGYAAIVGGIILASANVDEVSKKTLLSGFMKKRDRGTFDVPASPPAAPTIGSKPKPAVFPLPQRRRPKFL
jgi:hypothetical protein